MGHAARVFSTDLLLNGRQVSGPGGSLRFDQPVCRRCDDHGSRAGPGAGAAGRLAGRARDGRRRGATAPAGPALRGHGRIGRRDTPSPVRWSSWEESRSSTWRTSAPARTEADGGFSIESLSPETKVPHGVSPGATDPGFVTVSDGNVIVLPAAGRIHGKVTYRGETGSSVFVRAVYPDRWYLPSARSTVRKDGGYELAGLAPGRLTSGRATTAAFVLSVRSPSRRARRVSSTSSSRREAP